MGNSTLNSTVQDTYNQQGTIQVQHAQASLPQLGQDSASNQQILVQHIKNRLMIKETYKKKGIQTLDRQEEIIKNFKEIELDPNQSSVYDTIKSELSEKGYTDFKFLGQGSQGWVFLSKNKEINRRYAIKGIRVKNAQGKVHQDTFEQAQKEIETLRKCRGSPYVINLIDQIDGKEFIYLILSECQGTLREILEKSPNKKLNEISAIKYAKDIAEGLFHIHSQKCIANDLKMDNILIDYNGNAVVADLGLADKLTKTSGYGMNQYMGNLLFQAPECYNTTQYKEYFEEYSKLGLNISTKPTAKSESFSLGYLIYLMVHDFKSTLIFNKHQPLEYSNEFQKFTYKKQLQYIIDGLTQFKPEDRLSIKDVLIILKGIISFEFQLDQKFVEVLEGKKIQDFIRSFKSDIEFVQNESEKFYPIINNEQELLEDILSKMNQSQKESDEIIKQLNQQKSNLESLIEANQKNFEDIIGKLKQNNSILNSEIENLNSKLKNLESDLKSKGQEIQKIRSENEQLFNSNQKFIKQQEGEKLKKQKEEEQEQKKEEEQEQKKEEEKKQKELQMIQSKQKGYIYLLYLPYRVDEQKYDIGWINLDDFKSKQKSLNIIN